MKAAFAHDGEHQDTRLEHSHDPDISNKSINTKDPAFHLLIAATKPTLKLCKTLLSAAILNYPPPTLLGFGLEKDRDRPMVNMGNALKFLDGDDLHQDDLVLVIDEGVCFNSLSGRI